MKPFRIKFFQRKAPKVDPRSKELADAIVLELLNHGMVDKQKQAECTLELLNEITEYFKKITSGKDVDATVQSTVTTMTASLEKYGIESKEAREEIIFNSLNLFNTIMAKVQ